MKRFLVLLVVFISSTMFAQGDTPGWSKRPVTTALNSFSNGGPCEDESAYPAVQGQMGCPRGIYSYSGGVWNYFGHWMLIWGGGHADSGNNSPFAMTLNQMYRLANFSTPGHSTDNTCPGSDTNDDGTKTSAHSYGGLAFVPPITESSNKSLALTFGVKNAGNGCTLPNVWQLDLSTFSLGTQSSATWTRTYAGTTEFNGQWGIARYDPGSHTVLAAGANNQAYGGGTGTILYKYEIGTHNLKTLLNFGTFYDPGVGSGYAFFQETMAIDPTRRILASTKYTNDRIVFVDISSLTPTGNETLSSSNVTTIAIPASCSGAFLNYGGVQSSPTIQYDRQLNLFSFYPAHGNTLWLFNAGDVFHPGSAKDITVQTAYGPVAVGYCVQATHGSVEGTDYPQAGVLQGSNNQVFDRFDYAPEYAKYVYQPGNNTGSPATVGWTLDLQRNIIGQGCTTATVIDKDCDGYGVGSAFGPDADDNDFDVVTANDGILKYGTLAAFLSHLGYNPLHYWYISATSGNDSTCVKDDITKPCLTFNKVKTVGIVAGDIVLWRGGTYTSDGAAHAPIYLPPNGTSSNGVIFMAYPGEKVVFDTQGSFTSAIEACNDPTPSQYQTFDGFLLDNTNVGHAGIGFDTCESSHVTLRNTEIRNFVDGLYAFQDVHYLLVDNNISHDMGNHGFYPGARDLPNTNITFSNNVIYNIGLTCIQHNGRVTNLQWLGNICYNYQTSGLSFDEGVSNSFVKNNLVFNGLAKAFIIWNYPSTSPTIGEYDQTNNLIENNTFVIPAKSYLDGSALSNTTNVVGITNFGPYGSTGALADLTTGNTFRNNVFINHAGGPMFMVQTAYVTATCYSGGGCTGADYQMNGPNPGPIAAGLTWTNNDVYLSGANTMRLMNVRTLLGTPPTPPGSNPSSIDNWYNYASWATYNASTTGNVNVNPSVVHDVSSDWASPTLFNFGLQGSSTIIGAGSTLGVPTADIRNLTRPSPPSIGAYEYQAGTGTPVTVTSVAIQPSPASIQIAGTQTYTCIATWSNSTTDLCPSATWTSSSPSVATISAGTATGVAAGTTTITATYQGVTSNSASLTVLGTPVVNKTRIKGHPICRNCVFK